MKITYANDFEKLLDEVTKSYLEDDGPTVNQIHKLSKIMDNPDLILMDVDDLENYLLGMWDGVQRYKKQLPTLEDFLGWEEGVEYRRGGNILKVEGNHLLDKRPNGKFYNTNCNTAELIDLRNATKYELKYYAKIKGWELITSTYCHFGLDDFSELEVVDRIDGYRLSKSEWNELGINDENADFEEVAE